MSRRHALLQRNARRGAAGARPRVLHFALRHRDVPEGRSRCGRSRRSSPTTGCSSRPTRRFWRPCRIAASATSRPGSSRHAARRSRRCAASHGDGARGSSVVQNFLALVRGAFAALTPCRNLWSDARRFQVVSPQARPLPVNSATTSVPDLAQILRTGSRGIEAGRARVRAPPRVTRRADPPDGQVRPDERRQARPAGRAAHGRPPLRLHRRPGDSERRRRRVHPHRDARPRRHHRRRRDPPRPADRALAVGQRHHGAARRLPLHPLDGDGADAGHASRSSGCCATARCG